jgi:hypothetical protein
MVHKASKAVKASKALKFYPGKKEATQLGIASKMEVIKVLNSELVSQCKGKHVFHSIQICYCRINTCIHGV